MSLNNKEKALLIWEWHKIKVNLQLAVERKKLYFYEKNIWWASLGANIGHEEDGKNKKFERPVLILKKFNSYLAIIIPLTSRVKDNNKYYFKFLFNNHYSSAIISQLRIISSRRLIRKIGNIGTPDFYEIKRQIKKII